MQTSDNVTVWYTGVKYLSVNWKSYSVCYQWYFAILTHVCDWNMHWFANINIRKPHSHTDLLITWKVITRSSCLEVHTLACYTLLNFPMFRTRTYILHKWVIFGHKSHLNNVISVGLHFISNRSILIITWTYEKWGVNCGQSVDIGCR